MGVFFSSVRLIVTVMRDSEGELDHNSTLEAQECLLCHVAPDSMPTLGIGTEISESNQTFHFRSCRAVTGGEARATRILAC